MDDNIFHEIKMFLTHNGLYQLNQGLVRTVLNRYLGTNVHFNVSEQKTPSRIAYEKYINKNKELP